jgi:hypothetical protein
MGAQQNLAFVIFLLSNQEIKLFDTQYFKLISLTSLPIRTFDVLETEIFITEKKTKRPKYNDFQPMDTAVFLEINTISFIYYTKICTIDYAMNYEKPI